ncbi:MAG: bifunctional deaminase-reductase domain protein [Propionibacteriaceae bacterium]|nr:bifunctional deaminase-reductase domain protein [Propionibacteriaceae bacterium]
MSDQDTDYDGGPVFVLTHQPPDEPEQGVTFLTCDLAEAVATARAVAGSKNLEILGADLASQCLQRGLVDEVLVYVLPVLLGDGVRFSTSGLGRIDLEPFSNRQSGPQLPLRGPQGSEDTRSEQPSAARLLCRYRQRGAGPGPVSPAMAGAGRGGRESWCAARRTRWTTGRGAPTGLALNVVWL